MFSASRFVMFVATVILTYMAATLTPTVSALDLALFNETDSTRCIASQLTSREPRPLEFCYQYNSQSCCTPANDQAAKDAFGEFTSLGAGCAATDHKMRRTFKEVKQFACLACGQEYKYRKWVTDGANPANSGFRWRVCASFFFGTDGKGGLWRGDGKRFDECGVKAQTADGNEFLVPSVAYAGMGQAQIAEQFSAVLPSFISNFRVEIVNDTVPGADNEHIRKTCFASAARQSIITLMILIVVPFFCAMF